MSLISLFHSTLADPRPLCSVQRSVAPPSPAQPTNQYPISQLWYVLKFFSAVLVAHPLASLPRQSTMPIPDCVRVHKSRPEKMSAHIRKYGSSFEFRGQAHENVSLEVCLQGGGYQLTSATCVWTWEGGLGRALRLAPSRPTERARPLAAMGLPRALRRRRANDGISHRSKLGRSDPAVMRSNCGEILERCALSTTS